MYTYILEVSHYFYDFTQMHKNNYPAPHDGENSGHNNIVKWYPQSTYTQTAAPYHTQSTVFYMLMMMGEILLLLCHSTDEQKKKHCIFGLVCQIFSVCMCMFIILCSLFNDVRTSSLGQWILVLFFVF